MKKAAIYILTIPVYFNGFSQMKSSGYISENFVFLGIKAVRVNKDVYIREISAKDFKTNDNSVVKGFAIGDELYLDNGQGNDKETNDGIYTSFDTYQMKNEKKDTVVLSDKVVFGTYFKFEKELDKYLAEKGPAEKSGVKLKCDIRSCICSTCDCSACNNNWDQNLRWCFNAKDCSIEIGFGF